MSEAAGCIKWPRPGQLRRLAALASFSRITMKKCPQCNRTYADESLVIPAAINSEAHSSKTAVMSPEDGEAFAETPRPSKRGGPKRTKLTEQSFYESLDPKTAKALRDFFAKALDLGIGLKKDSGQGSLMLKLGIR